MTQFDQARMSKFPGRAFFRKKKKLRHPRSTWVACMVGLGLPRLAKQAEPAMPKIGGLQNMVLGLMGPLVAPNRVLTGSPGRESRAGAAGGVGLPPNIPKWTEIFGDPDGLGEGWSGFSGLFPNWPGMVRGGPWTIIWGYLGLLGIQKKPRKGPMVGYLKV